MGKAFKTWFRDGFEVVHILWFSPTGPTKGIAIRRIWLRMASAGVILALTLAIAGSLLVHIGFETIDQQQSQLSEAREVILKYQSDFEDIFERSYLYAQEDDVEPASQGSLKTALESVGGPEDEDKAYQEPTTVGGLSKNEHTRQLLSDLSSSSMRISAPRLDDSTKPSRIVFEMYHHGNGTLRGHVFVVKLQSHGQLQTLPDGIDIEDYQLNKRALERAQRFSMRRMRLTKLVMNKKWQNLPGEVKVVATDESGKIFFVKSVDIGSDAIARGPETSLKTGKI